MNRAEYEEYLAAGNPEDPTISIDVLAITSGTLAYGYTNDSENWHAYVQHGAIHVLVWRGREITAHEHGTELPVRYLRPDKRVYPDTVDAHFAYLMRNAGMPLPFIGNYDFERAEAVRLRSPDGFEAEIRRDLAY